MSNFKTIHATELKQFMDAENALVIDVREPGEYESLHIQGARNIPLSRFDLSAFAQLPDGKKLVIHCQSGGRSAQACKALLESGYGREIYNLEDNMASWEKAGLPLKKGQKQVLPLDRQTQIALGSALILFTVLGFAAHSAFFALSALIGAGLLNAGLTGWCGLARMLAKMPWNR